MLLLTLLLSSSWLPPLLALYHGHRPQHPREHKQMAGGDVDEDSLKTLITGLSAGQLQKLDEYLHGGSGHHESHRFHLPHLQQPQEQQQQHGYLPQLPQFSLPTLPSVPQFGGFPGINVAEILQDPETVAAMEDVLKDPAMLESIQTVVKDPEAMENLMKMVDDPDFMKDLKEEAMEKIKAMSSEDVLAKLENMDIKQPVHVQQTQSRVEVTRPEQLDLPPPKTMQQIQQEELATEQMVSHLTNMGLMPKISMQDKAELMSMGVAEEDLNNIMKLAENARKKVRPDAEIAGLVGSLSPEELQALTEMSEGDLEQFAADIADTTASTAMQLVEERRKKREAGSMISDSRFDYVMAGVKKRVTRSKKTMEEKISELQRMIDRLDKTKEMLLHEMNMVRKRAMENKKDLHFAQKNKRSVDIDNKRSAGKSKRSVEKTKRSPQYGPPRSLDTTKNSANKIKRSADKTKRSADKTKRSADKTKRSADKAKRSIEETVDEKPEGLITKAMRKKAEMDKMKEMSDPDLSVEEIKALMTSMKKMIDTIEGNVKTQLSAKKRTRRSTGEPVKESPYPNPEFSFLEFGADGKGEYSMFSQKRARRGLKELFTGGGEQDKVLDHKQPTYTVPHFQEDKGFTSGIFESRELVMPEHLKSLESPNRRKRQAGDKFRAQAYPGAGGKEGEEQAEDVLSRQTSQHIEPHESAGPKLPAAAQKKYVKSTEPEEKVAKKKM